MGITDRIKERIRKNLNDFLGEDKYDISIDGRLITDSSSDVDDPTGKFSGIKHIGNVFKYEPNKKNVEFFKSEYDLSTIANAIQIDGILNRAVNLFVEQIMKNGFDCVSKDDKVQIHAKRRLDEISGGTNISIFELIANIAKQLVSYGNAYVIKVRNKSLYGKPYQLYGKMSKPIVGLFLAEATTMEIGLDDKGQIDYYRQNIRGETRTWDARDVIHFTYNKIPGTLTGRSNIIPILDDIRALRKLEEEIEILGFQYSIPLYLYKVGTKEQPAAPGEVAEAAANVNSMPAYGMLVVPGNHNIEVPSNNSTPVEIMEFVNHFKFRVFSGLGVSPVAMGEVSTSNRNTGEVSDVSMQTITKSYQRIIKHKFEMEVLRELLLDGGYDFFEKPVEFNFPEIDLENQIKKETNTIQKFQNNLITRTEARFEMDYDKKLDESDTFLKLIEMPKLDAQNQVKLDIAKKKAIDTKVRPSNQHGKSTGRPKYKKDYLQDSIDVNNKLIDLLISDSKSNFNKIKYSTEITKKIEDSIKASLSSKIEDAKLIYGSITLSDSIINDYIKHVKTLLSYKIARVTDNSYDTDKLFVAADDMNTFILEQNLKIDNFVKMLLYQSLGFRTILIETSDCIIHQDAINIDVTNMDYFKIPPFSYKCSCLVSDNKLHG